MKRVLQCLVFLWLIAYASAAWGQATTSLRGTVTDPGGSVIVGAKVTITNVETSFTRSTITTADGAYAFLEVTPATYTLGVEMKGFQKFEQVNLVLRVDLPSTVNVQMKVGSITEIVTVTTEVPTLNTTDASVGNTMGHTEIEDLPIPEENTVLLLSLQPGVAYNGENILQDSYDTRAGAVNGERSDQNNITLDGVSNNNEFEGYAFNGVLPTTPFSVEEFRVTTSNYEASEGRSSGAQISLVTKGGTNSFHGKLYEFNRNTVGEANDYFVKLSQLSNGEKNVPGRLIWNNFGGALGGPIWKDRFFFFVNVEAHRQSLASSVERAVPSATLRDGIIEYKCPRNADGSLNTVLCPGMSVAGASGKSYPIPAGYYGLGPTDLTKMDPLGIGPSQGAMAYMQAYPEPNDPNYSDAPNYAGYRFSAPVTNHQEWYIARLDYKITQNGNHALFFRGTAVDNRYADTPFVPGTAPMDTQKDLAKGFVTGYTGVFGTHWVNNFRYGLTRDSYGYIGNSTQPWVFFRDMDQNITYSYGHTEPVHNFVDSVSWMKGAHSFEFGFNFLLSRLNSFDYGISFSDALTNADWIAQGGFANKNDGLNPAYGCSTGGPCYPAVDSGFNHAYDFPLAALMGIESEVDAVFNYSVSATTANQIAQGAPIKRHWASDSYNLYFQDTWKVRRGLSVTYGLNYQLMTPMTETAGQEVAPTINIGDWFDKRQAGMLKGIPDNQALGGALIQFGPSGSTYGKPGLYSTQTKNFAPRLGLAWTPHSDWGFLKSLFGQDKTVIRAGAGMYYSNFGPELALSYANVGEFGLSTDITNPSSTLPLANAPRIGSSISDMNVIPFNAYDGTALINPPASSYSFPATPPQYGFAIQHGIDQSIKTPYSYAVDLSVQRQLPGQVTLDVAYVGHFAHRLLALDDVAAPTDLVDPKSGIDWNAAAKRMSQLWRAGTPESSINATTIGPTAQYWQDMFVAQPSYSLCTSNGSTTSMLTAIYDVFSAGCGSLYNETSASFLMDLYGFPVNPVGGSFSYYNSQYSSLWAWRSIAWSNYNSLQVGLHKQTSHGILFGFNYTFSKSLDVESTAERGVHYLTDSVINAWDPGQMYGPSDFDLRHQINAYWLWELPFGRGKRFGANTNALADALLGGWQWGGTTRWTSGFPVSVFQGYVWPTNWDEMGWSDATGQPIVTGRTSVNGVPNIFKNPENCTNSSIPCAANAFDYAYPGESGVKNNVRGDGYFSVDMNLSKQWRIPHTENHSLQLRWSVFNVLNSVRFDAFSMQDEWDVPDTFGRYTQTLTNPRRMEFSLIYSF